MSEAPLAGDTGALRKARGAFFTPPALAQFIADWAIRSAADTVLEPSCGEAAFLVSSARRLVELGAVPGEGMLSGVELHAASAQAAAESVAGLGWPASIETGDFFEVPAERRHTAVIGNPPYVRYQDFAGADRLRSREAALAAGVPLTGLASSWAAFTVHAAQFLRPGGRLGLVLPAELLTVNYAAEVRSHLMATFGRVRLVLFTERVFPGVLEEVVLLLAEDALAPGGTDHCELQQVRSIADLAGLAAGGVRWAPPDHRGKWTRALLSEAALAASAEVDRLGMFETLHSWGDTTLGMVTGANRYFALPPERAAELGIADHELLRLSPPGSRHLRGLRFSDADWQALGAGGSATWLFRPPADLGECSPGARAYIEAGERLGIHHAYKCRVRAPWWRVPLVAAPDLLLTYMNADTPRLTVNSAGVRHLNSVHGVYLRPGRRTLGADLLPLASLNTITLLGAETVGRAYGGGMLKLEPKEADQLPVPAPSLIMAATAGLRAVRARVRAALAGGELLAAVRMVDDVLLDAHMGLPGAQRGELERARAELAGRRTSRGGTRESSLR